MKPDGWPRRFGRVEHEDRDTEIFERIPWESLEKGSQRRWWVYLGAAALFMGGIGISIGRGTASPVAPAPADTTQVVPIAEEEVAPPPSIITSTTMATSGTWAEADLMAAPVPGLETSAASLAEWFVVDHFTRDGSSGEEGRSFVDWAGPIAFEWVESGGAEVTVLIRRLATPGEGSYQRLPDEAWKVVLSLDDTGWKVVDGPYSAQPADSVVDIDPLDSSVPDQVGELAGDEPVTGASRIGPDWVIEVDWVDDAGLSWPVRRLLPDGP